MPQVEEMDYNLERWMSKWQFMLDNDAEMSKATAVGALEQLNEIISYEIRKEKDSTPIAP
jgi:hypothetical protein